MKRNSTLLLSIAAAILSFTRASAQNAPHPGSNPMVAGRFEHPFAIGVIVVTSVVLLLALAWIGIKIYMIDSQRNGEKQ